MFNNVQNKTTTVVRTALPPTTVIQGSVLVPPPNMMSHMPPPPASSTMAPLGMPPWTPTFQAGVQPVQAAALPQTMQQTVLTSQVCGF